MGRGGRRIGAGRPRLHGTVEGCARLDVRTVCGMDTMPTSINATFRTKAHNVAYNVSTTQTACRFGGYRQWLVCPHCKGRVCVLYLWRQSLACRTCHGLSYQSQSFGGMAAAFARMFRLTSKLGPDFTRPKGMHQQTHLRLLIRAHDAFANASSMADQHITCVSRELEGLGLLDSNVKEWSRTLRNNEGS